MDKPLYVIVPFCSIFILVGATVMFTEGRAIVRGLLAKNWPQATGRVLSVNSKAGGKRRNPTVAIQVRYIYTVDGQAYESTTIHPAYRGSNFDAGHRALVALLQPDQQVRVYYNASQPSRSTLSVGFYSATLSPFFFGFIFSSVGLGMLLCTGFLLAGDWDFARGITAIK